MKESTGKNDEKKLLDYLQRNMTEEEKHAFELEQMNDGFSFDAIEGLSVIQPDKITMVTNDLNNQLKQHLHKKSRKKRRPLLFGQMNFYYGLILLILLVIITYWIIKNMLH